MPSINWNAALVGAEPAWRATRGAGVRVALLDSGGDLSREELQHLDSSGYLFDVARADFVPTDTALTTADGIRGVDQHGTRMLEALAAESEGDGPLGLVPDAEIFIVKVASANGIVSQRYFLNGLQLALKLDVDLVITGQCPMVVRGHATQDFSIETDKIFAHRLPEFAHRDIGRRRKLGFSQ